MVLLDDKIYQETKEIVLGKRQKGPLLSELSAWFKARYSVSVLNIQFSQLIASSQYRLLLIVESTQDYQKLHHPAYEPEEQALEFRRLALKYRFADEAKLNNLFVTCNDFSEEAKTDANWKAMQEVKELIRSQYACVWCVEAMFSHLVVFYYRDRDIQVNKNNGTSQAIIDVYYSILKKYDELDYFTRENIVVKFDSKENLDKNYEGSLFYYSR
jgi:hypothetical protein